VTTSVINNAKSIPASATRPPGRPPGSRNQKTLFVESLFTEDAEKMKAIVAKAIEKAIEADLAKIGSGSDCAGPERQARSIRATAAQDAG
jgi:hypothetical protein